MKLSEEQIQALYKFTRKRLVEHYDLQTELVDHLANGIEAQWKINESVPFKDAVNTEFAKFGSLRFKTIIKKRKKAMSKRYRGHILSFYKEYFRLPKIFLIVGLTILFYSVLQIFEPEYKLIFMAILFFIVAGIFGWHGYKNRKTYEKKIVSNQKRWMLEEKIFLLGDGAQLALYPFYIVNVLPGLNISLNNSFIEAGICLFMVCYFIISYVMIFVIPQKAEELLSETYPEYKMMQT